jgi:hypothetical protein
MQNIANKNWRCFFLHHLNKLIGLKQNYSLETRTWVKKYFGSKC